jgi:hypothetical protein
VPILSNAKQERFAQGLANGMTANDAYVFAGYRENRRNAARLKAKDPIEKRVLELHSAIVGAATRAAEKEAETFVVTLSALMRHAEECRVRALELGQVAAAVSAIKELGVLSGLRVEKRENRNVSIEEVSDADLAAIALGQSGGVTAH